MELRQLDIFRTAAKTLSFTRTARQMNYAQSSVSAQIQNLEEELGVALFDRLGRRIQLTSQGRELLGYAEKILGLADEAASRVSSTDEPAGELRIGAPESLCVYRLPAVLRAFHAAYPNVKVTIQPSLAQVWRRHMREGVSDAAIVLTTGLNLEGYDAEPLVYEEIMLLTYPDHPLARAEAVRPADLRNELLLLTEPGCNYRQVFERDLRGAGVTPTSVLEFTSLEAIKQCVMGGMGITQLPRMAVKAELADGRLVPIPWVGPNVDVYTQLVLHKDKWVSPTLEAFLQMARSMLAGNAGGFDPENAM